MRTVARPHLSPDALDELENANAEIGYIKALCTAVERSLENIRESVAPSGRVADENLLQHVLHTDTLLSLQLDRIVEAQAGISCAIHGWPRS